MAFIECGNIISFPSPALHTTENVTMGKKLRRQARNETKEEHFPRRPPPPPPDLITSGVSLFFTHTLAISQILLRDWWKRRRQRRSSVPGGGRQATFFAIVSIRCNTGGEGKRARARGDKKCDETSGLTRLGGFFLVLVLGAKDSIRSFSAYDSDDEESLH